MVDHRTSLNFGRTVSLVLWIIYLSDKNLAWDIWRSNYRPPKYDHCSYIFMERTGSGGNGFYRGGGDFSSLFSYHKLQRRLLSISILIYTKLLNSKDTQKHGGGKRNLEIEKNLKTIKTLSISRLHCIDIIAYHCIFPLSWRRNGAWFFKKIETLEYYSWFLSQSYITVSTIAKLYNRVYYCKVI